MVCAYLDLPEELTQRMLATGSPFRYKISLSSQAKQGIHVVDPKFRATGKWEEEEHERYVEALQKFPAGPWRIIASYVGTRTQRQCMTHHQRILRRLKRTERNRNLIKAEEDQVPMSPPPLQPKSVCKITPQRKKSPASSRKKPLTRRKAAIDAGIALKTTLQELDTSSIQEENDQLLKTLSESPNMYDVSKIWRLVDAQGQHEHEILIAEDPISWIEVDVKEQQQEEEEQEQEQEEEEKEEEIIAWFEKALENGIIYKMTETPSITDYRSI